MNKKKEEIEKRFNLDPSNMLIFSESFHVFAYAHPNYPIITSDNELSLASWGLVPFWVKNREQAKDLSNKTLNARSETIFEKPSYKQSIKSKRCIIPVDGFYESHEVNEKKYPYYVNMKNNSIFGLAGLWDIWIDTLSGKKIKSFSIITTEANSFMANIHNTKKRMPVILPTGKEKLWLNELSKTDILKYFIKDDTIPLKAHSVSRMIYSKEPVNSPEVQKEVLYHELI